MIGFFRLAIFSFITLFSLKGLTKSFQNRYCEFELPPKWACQQEGSEFVCQSVDKEFRKEAVIILAAKRKGENDSLAAYQAFLKSPKTFNSTDGKKQVSQPRKTTKKVVNGHTWIDSLHLASELPGFYTRYMATVKGNSVGIVVTFSVAKDHYQDYKNLFDKVIESLKVFAPTKHTTDQWVAKGNKDSSAKNIETVPYENFDDELQVNQSQKEVDESSDEDLLFLIFAVVAIVIILRRLKKKKG